MFAHMKSHPEWERAGHPFFLGVGRAPTGKTISPAGWRTTIKPRSSFFPVVPSRVPHVPHRSPNSSRERLVR